MKIFNFVILTILFILVIATQANATCRTIPITYYTYDPYPNGNPRTCNMSITYCYDCSPTGMSFSIGIQSIHNPCGIPINSDFEEQANTAMLVDYLNQPGCCIVPCDYNGLTERTVDIQLVKCWKHVHQLNDPPTTYDIVQCQSTAECISVYKVCVYFDQTGAHLNKIFQSKFSWPGVNCPLLQEPLTPPNGVDPNGVWETECFMFPWYCQ